MASAVEAQPRSWSRLMPSVLGRDPSDAEGVSESSPRELAMHSLRLSAAAEAAALRAELRDVRAKTSVEVAVWKAQAEELEAGFLRKASAEVAIWKLDADMSKRKLSSAKEELLALR